MTHDNAISEFGPVVTPSGSASIDSVLAGGDLVRPLEQVVEEEAAIQQREALEAKEEGPWFMNLGAKGPIIAGRFNHAKGAWDITIQDGPGDQLLDPRRRNLLQRALNIAVRRHARSLSRESLLQHRKLQAQRDREVQAALTKSALEKNLSLYPGHTM